MVIINRWNLKGLEDIQDISLFSHEYNPKALGCSSFSVTLHQNNPKALDF